MAMSVFGFMLVDNGSSDRHDHSDVLIVFDYFGADGESVIVLMGQPQPASHLWVDVLDPLFFSFIPVGQNNYLILSELIPIVIICHDVLSLWI